MVNLLATSCVGYNMTTRRAQPFLCRTGLHHKWEMATTDDGEEFVRCAKCLKDKWTGLGNDRSVAANVIANYGSIN